MLTSERWVKGNTHTHSTISDGDAPPERVAEIYRTLGYGFCYLTDHDKQAPMDLFRKLSDSRFLFLPGEELTPESGDFAVHVNALGVERALTAIREGKSALTAQRNAQRVRDAGGLPQLNHPSCVLSDPDTVRLMGSPSLIEVYNHGVAQEGLGLMAQSLFEGAWNTGLDAGLTMWGVAADDAHHYTRKDKGANPPGGGWVMVRVPRLTAEEVLNALRRGRFYSSTGVSVQSYRVRGNQIEVRVQPKPGVRYTVELITTLPEHRRKAEGDRVRLEAPTATPWARVRVVGSDRTMAWLQPIWRGRPVALQW